MNKDIDKNSIIYFLLFAFGIPLICVALIRNFSIFQTRTLNYIFYGIEAMTPTLAALMATLFCGGKTALSDFLQKKYTKNIKISYIILAFLLPSVVLIITKITTMILFEGTPFITSITIKKFIIIFWALIAEELGWRGFLQEKVDKCVGHITTPVILGCIWALWHYHFFLLGTNSAPKILFLLACIAESYSYYWITIKSKSNVIPASIWHFTGNLWFNLFLLNPEHNRGSITPYMLYVVYSTIMAACIIIWGNCSIKRDRLPNTVNEI